MKRFLLILIIAQTIGLIGFKISLASELLKIGNLEKKGKPYGTDMTLPFKSQAAAPSVTLTKCCVESSFPTLTSINHIVIFNPISDDELQYSTDLLNIWQPPKA